MSLIAFFLSTLLLLPYLGGGIYTLRVRYFHHEEFSLVTEAVTLVAVTSFLVLELSLLGTWMKDMQVQYIFMALGLFVSATALYGPMLVSLSSRVFVDLVLPTQRDDLPGPDFGPAEALERLGDHEGAVKECMIIARIYPKEPQAAFHIGDNLTKLNRYSEATDWFERGLAQTDDPERSLRIAFRLSEIYTRKLEDSEKARAVLSNYLEKYPEAERNRGVRARLERLTAVAQPKADEGTTALPGQPEGDRLE